MLSAIAILCKTPMLEVSFVECFDYGRNVAYNCGSNEHLPWLLIRVKYTRMSIL